MACSLLAIARSSYDDNENELKSPIAHPLAPYPNIYWHRRKLMKH